jgi:hypothetical protein
MNFLVKTNRKEFKNVYSFSILFHKNITIRHLIIYSVKRKKCNTPQFLDNGLRCIFAVLKRGKHESKTKTKIQQRI